MSISTPFDSAFRGTLLRLLWALGPLCILLTASQFIFGSGWECYAFWREWKHLHPYMTDGLRFMTNWGNPALYVVYASILGCALYHKNNRDLRLVLWYVCMQLCIALALTYVLKNIFGMPRPFVGDVAPQPWSFVAMYHSFPSGHATEIVGAALPLALWRRRTSDAIIMGLWIATVGYSRVYLGRHFLIDIWGGLALGCLSAWLILYAAQRNTQPKQMNFKVK